MSWYILKNRRHLGPFGQEALKKALHNGELLYQDYLIAEQDVRAGELKYIRVNELFTPPPANSSGTSENPAAAATTPKVDRPLGSFSEEEILTNEVSRIFAEALDPVELVSISQKGTSEMPTAPLVVRPKGNSWEQALSWLRLNWKMATGVLGLAAVVSILIGLMGQGKISFKAGSAKTARKGNGQSIHSAAQRASAPRSSASSAASSSSSASSSTLRVPHQVLREDSRSSSPSNSTPYESADTPPPQVDVPPAPSSSIEQSSDAAQENGQREAEVAVPPAVENNGQSDSREPSSSSTNGEDR